MSSLLRVGRFQAIGRHTCACPEDFKTALGTLLNTRPPQKGGEVWTSLLGLPGLTVGRVVERRHAQLLGRGVHDQLKAADIAAVGRTQPRHLFDLAMADDASA